MDERLKGVEEKAKAASGKATTAAKERVEQIKAREQAAHGAVKKSLDERKSSKSS